MYYLKDKWKNVISDIFHFLQESVLKFINLTYPCIEFSFITHITETSSFFPCLILASYKGKGIPITGHQSPGRMWMQRSTYSLHLHHSSFSNPPVASPTSQLILQPFHCFTYVTAHSPTLLLLLLRHRLFSYVTWRAAYGLCCLSAILSTSLSFFIIISLIYCTR